MTNVTQHPASQPAPDIPQSDGRPFVDDLSELKQYKPVDAIVDMSVGYMSQKDDDDIAYITVVYLADNRAAIVCTRRGYSQHARKLQNIRTLLTQKHKIMSVTEWAAPPEIIQDYVDAARKTVKQEEVAKDTEAEQRARNSALQELNIVVKEALELNASDIHITVAKTQAYIKYRVSGRLTEEKMRERDRIQFMVAAALSAKSDDFNALFNEHQVDANTIDVDPITYIDRETGKRETRNIRLRIQKTPSHGGFRVTARLQDTGTAKQIPLNALGLDPDIEFMMKEAFKQPQGIILLSGPVGQGKTTTMVALNQIPIAMKKKIISLEDPIEIVQEGVSQTACQPGHEDLNFPNMIKVAMREDMDVLEVSEVRDYETAEAAIRAALTGRLVGSTTHANNAIGIVSRLLDLGVRETQLAQPNVLGYLTGQRLIPKLCPHCKIAKDPNDYPNITFPTHFNANVFYVRNEQGCKECSNGESGRKLIMEVVQVTKHAREYIENRDFDGWRKHLIDNGWRDMAYRAWEQANQGVIDPLYAAQSVPGMLVDEEKEVNYQQIAQIASEELE